LGQWANLFSSPQRSSGRASRRVSGRARQLASIGIGIGIGIGIETRPSIRKKHKSIARAARDIYVLINYFKMETTTRDQKPQNDPHKNHTRTTQDPQRPKMRKVACRAGFPNIRHARTTKTTKTT